MKKFLALALAAVLAVGVAACSSGETTTETTETKETVKIKVGATPAPHAEILEAVKETLAADGIELEIVEFNDYVIPNTATESGELDANYFQHQPYLTDFNAQNGTHIVSAGAIHVEPMGLYGGKQSNLDALK